MAKIKTSNQTDTYQLEAENYSPELTADKNEESKKEDKILDTDE